MERRQFVKLMGLGVASFVLGGCKLPVQDAAAENQTAQAAHMSGDFTNLAHCVKRDTAPKVFFTKEINGTGLVKLHEALGRAPQGNVGIKLTFESPGSSHLDPQMLRPLVEKLRGTFIDSNGFSAPRNTTAGHHKVAADHGFSAVGAVDILDADGELDMPVVGGKHLKYHRTGSHFAKYDSVISIVHFKPHHLRDYGGTIKNMTICLASTSGKAILHSAGQNESSFSEPNMDAFLESMADGAKAAMDYKKDRWVFINVLNHIVPDDSCSDTKPLDDIGIVASLDPVAVDQAAIDFTYGAAPTPDIRAEWERTHQTRVLQYAEELGVGSREYQCISID